jgi:hypothetical protein
VQTFGEYVSDLLTDKNKWENIAKQSKITAAKYYTWDSLYKVLDEAI